MDLIARFAKLYLIPGSMGFLLLGLSVGAIALLRGERVRRWGRRWLIGLSLGYWLLSLPMVSQALVGILASGITSVESADQAGEATAVVVLGGGSVTLRAHGYELSLLSEQAGLRALEAARVYHLLGDPWMFVSGGTAAESGVLTPESLALEQALLAFGVPGDRIVRESDSRDTYEQAVAMTELLDEHQVARFILVTSPTHMRRAWLTFRKAGLDPVPSLASQRSETWPQPLTAVSPDLRSLGESSAALRELLGLLYYAFRGWI
jgi:uncharacterized SAM-binding protein YcdF (DUF218 family)